MASLAAKPAYPRPTAVRKFVKAARDLGLDVAGFSVAPDGTICVMEARAMPMPAGNLFDQLDAEGRL